MSLTIRDFYPCNQWREEFNGDHYANGTPLFIIDDATGKQYLNEYPHTISTKCFLLACAGTPIIHSAFLSYDTFCKLLKIMTLFHFWAPNKAREGYSLNNRLHTAGTEFLLGLSAPLILIGLELAAIYGIFRPYDGRKLISSLEELALPSHFYVAPCFHPRPTHHFFGGDIHVQNAF